MDRTALINELVLSHQWRETNESIYEGDRTFSHPLRPNDLLVLSPEGHFAEDEHHTVGRLSAGDMVLQQDATTYDMSATPDRHGRYPVASTGLIFTIYSGVADEVILNDLNERGYR